MKLSPRFTAGELKRRYRSCNDAKEARRLHVLWLVSQGSSLKEAADLVGFGLSWAREIVHRYNRDGIASVKDRHRVNPGGKKSRLSDEQKRELAEALKMPPPSGGGWTGTKVAEWITSKTGMVTYPQLGWVYLRLLRGGKNS
jgi:transposase